MRLEWLDDILAVADAGSLARAAELRHVSQPALTRRLRVIEAALGVPLFERRHKPLTLLPEIVPHLPAMRSLAAQLRQLRDGLAQSGGARGLTLACQHAITTTHSPAIVAALTEGQARPVRVRSENREDCLLRLLAAEADLAVVYDVPQIAPLALGGAFERVSLGPERLIPVAAPDLPLGSDFRYIGYPGDVFLGQVMDRALLPRIGPDRRLRRCAETALTLAAHEYARRGIGVAWLPESMARDDLSAGRLVHLGRDVPALDMEIWMIRLPGIEGSGWEDDWQRLADTLSLAPTAPL
ncbi:LysR family transcriptional regulator [Roseovarius sp. A46]|uniref:LysR family transcriptional regulator n=1 Tax=Roseovarius sp. A46 TaxID=2109331 RepID=UPI0010116EEF|nr:LysR family transcriptional regulator [Roseovarius sp. A46]RXV70136.1 LysR family transcriptional regulator [Roseovarius sp. A46]